jgi:predicted acylesterase/phospholipase RssA
MGQPSQQPDKPELRIALGMRGGVSLAVWMGGACSEIDRFRRALADEDAPDYRDLLRAAGYGSVAVDVVAGASAGGLNSVLLSCSVVHGMPFGSEIRDLWLRLGDLGGLVRKAELGQPPISPLDGDRCFYGPLARTLERLVGATPVRPPAPRLDVILTGTLFTPVRRTRFQDLGPPIVERRNRAWFRFQSRPSAADDGNGREDGDGFGTTPSSRTAALRRLAYAARATSSFPGAFEPASIGVTKTSVAPDDDVVLPLPATHYGCFSESRQAGDGRDRDFVIDGGVLDNIPVAWAVRSVAAAPADRVVDRWLLYLQPVPFRPPEAGETRRPSALETVQRARDLQGGSETLADDLDELERLKAETRRRDGMRQVLEYALGQLPEGTDVDQFMAALYDRALAASDSYRQRAGAMEAARIRALWIDPLPVLGADPLSFANVTQDPLEAEHVPLLQRLPDVGPDLVLAADGMGEPLEPPGVERLANLLPSLRTPQALARTVSLLLDAARELGAAGLPIKEELYRLRTRIELVIAHADRALAAAPRLERTPQPDLVELVRRTVWAPAEVQAGWPRRTDLWDGLVEQARAVADAAKGGRRRAFVGCLVGAAADQQDPDRATRAVLAAVELLTGPLRPDPLAETTGIRFHMVSAWNDSELVRELAQGLPTGGDGYDRLPVGDKLAGNQLNNFGAFLSARWRLNDWTWGRLDAAQSLVEVATAPRVGLPDPLPQFRKTFGLPDTADLATTRAAVVRRLHDAILREELPLFQVLADSPPPQDQKFPPRLAPGDTLDVTALLKVGKESLGRLALRNVTRLPEVAGLVGLGAYAAGGSLAQRLGRAVRGLFRR